MKKTKIVSQPRWSNSSSISNNRPSFAICPYSHLWMNATSVSLLERLRQPAQSEAWSRFVSLYTPLIYHWSRRAGLSTEEAADLVQDVLTVLVAKLPEFRYDPDRSFRGWLRSVTLNKWRENRRRRTPSLAGEHELADLRAAEETQFWETEYHQHLVGRAMKLMQSEFQPNTWQACWECVVSGKRPTDVARELGMSIDSVYAAKSRVLHRLREELAGLLD